MMRNRMCPTALGLACYSNAAAILSAPLGAQSTPASTAVSAPRVFYACYVPLIGTVYLIQGARAFIEVLRPATGPLANVPFS